MLLCAISVGILHATPGKKAASSGKCTYSAGLNKWQRDFLLSKGIKESVLYGDFWQLFNDIAKKNNANAHANEE